MHNICTLIPYIYLVLLQFIINNKESIFFVPYKIYSFFALMGNPVPLKIIQLFSENLIREILEDPVPLKLSQDLSIKLIRDFLTDPLQKCNPYFSFIQITLIRDFSENL